MIADPLATRQRARLRETTAAYALQALMLASSGLMVEVGLTLDPRPWLVEPVTYERWLVALLVSAALMLVGGWSLLRFPNAGRRMGLLSLLGFGFVLAPGLVGVPARALLVVLVLAAFALRVRSYAIEAPESGPVPVSPEIARHPRLFTGAVEATTWAAFAAWFLGPATGLAGGPYAQGAALLTFAVSLVYAAVWVQRSIAFERGRRRLMFALLLPWLVAAALSWRNPEWALNWLALHQVFVLGLLRARRRDGNVVLGAITEHPARLIATTFFLIAVFGGVVLSLPICSATGEGVRPIDAFFTAMSATCVTGLIVVDTPTAFSTVGHVVIMALFQVGGIGIMTFSTAGVLVLGRRMGLRQEVAISGVLAGEGGELGTIIRRILVVTFGTEAIAALLLAVLFRFEGDPAGTALWRGLFTAVSAFNNAGFALQTDSIVPYQHNVLILHVIATTVIVGGLGPAVVYAAPEVLRGRTASLQTKLVLLMSPILLVACAFLFAVVEWNNTLAGLSTWEKLHNSWFDSAVTRTAGFNSVDYTAVHPATETVTMVMMFIGGAPLSTAGGVKVTTIALIVMSVMAAVRGRSEVAAFGRRVSHDSIYKSVAIMTVGTAGVFLAFVAIQLTQSMPFAMGLFEVVSALGTVGLSVGGTGRLDGVGKVIIMICMFIGRVGPITVFLLLTEQRGRGKWAYPEERVAVG